MLERFYRVAALLLIFVVIAVFFIFGTVFTLILLASVGILRLLFYFSAKRNEGSIIHGGRVIDVSYSEIKEPLKKQPAKKSTKNKKNDAGHH